MKAHMLMMAALFAAGWAEAAVAPIVPTIDLTPSSNVLARADAFKPPRLAAFATRLASQPDMTGAWRLIYRPDDCMWVFDPENATCPPRRPEGEVVFGPLPGSRNTAIPYNDTYKKIYEQHIAEALNGKSRDTFAACIPYGVPRMVGSTPGIIDIIQTPDLMLWYSNYTRTQRRIFFDREHPKSTMVFGVLTEPDPTYSGHSVGHWEGNTLVVDTVRMIPAVFDETGAVFSDKLHLVERIRLVTNDVLEVQMTLDDPEAFTKPWVVTRYWTRADLSTNSPPQEARSTDQVRDYQQLSDKPCIPNVLIDENGFQRAMLPQEIEAEAARVQGRAAPAN